jgi:hypothetical protein
MGYVGEEIFSQKIADIAIPDTSLYAINSAHVSCSQNNVRPDKALNLHQENPEKSNLLTIDSKEFDRSVHRHDLNSSYKSLTHRTKYGIIDTE